MKLRALIPLFALGLAWCTTGLAGITDFQYTSDYSNFTCNATISYNLDRSIGTVAMDAYQYGGHGLMGGTITTDSANDPSLVLNGEVDNDTSFNWTGYNINVYMNRPFTLSGVGVGPLPPGWNFTFTPAAHGPGTYYGANEYVASIQYSQGLGPVVAPGGEFDFSYTLNFSGSTGYSFTAEMNPVPEPTVAALALLGGGILFARSRKNRSK
jgi:hypothetical protein